MFRFAVTLFRFAVAFSRFAVALFRFTVALFCGDILLLVGVFLLHVAMLRFASPFRPVLCSVSYCPYSVSRHFVSLGVVVCSVSRRRVPPGVLVFKGWWLREPTWYSSLAGWEAEQVGPLARLVLRHLKIIFIALHGLQLLAAAHTLFH